MSEAPRDAAAVILVREKADSAESSELEVLLLCRHRGAGFMASAFVFPGGVAEAQDEGDLRITAARELFEEGGILLSDRDFATDEREAIRARVAAGESAVAVLHEHGARFDGGQLSYFAHWLTPTAEKRRYSAQFFVARLPSGQQAAFDDVETVDQVWVTAKDALCRCRELKLPPPQVRSFMEMSVACQKGWTSLLELSNQRAERPAIILPRFAPITSPGGAQFALLLPWDPDYQSLGTGDAIVLHPDHPLASGPSRFVLEDETWKNISAPDSPTAE